MNQRYRYVAVHACRQCNSLAGKKVDSTFIDRRRRIVTKLGKRCRKLLGTADWTDEKLNGLGPVLRGYVGNRLHLLH